MFRSTLSVLMAGTFIVSQTAAAYAQVAPARPAARPAPAPAQAAIPAPAPVAAQRVIRAITVTGNQRLEADTVRAYSGLRVGQPYDRAALDGGLRALSQTELFSDFQITDNGGALVIQVTENPVINRVILEGNRRLKEDKIRPELRLAPRQIYTRSRVRADVARIIELYRRQGRYAASIEPKLVRLDQNRVDIVFEISEGDRSRVRQINILGNTAFNDGQLKGEMATRERRLSTILSSNTTYDPDRLAYDQQKLRQFYLTQGYADFRIVSAVAELTDDRQDFIITYVVEEGERYKFGPVTVDSQLRDLSADLLQRTLPMKEGDWYNAKSVEDTVTGLSETAGLLGYAFADVRPRFTRDPATRTMGIVFQVNETPRVYVERIDVNGNTNTQDKVVRREFRLNEGDAFNSVFVNRTQDRINSLGYFQENLELEQEQGSAPDRVVLSANVEEKPTGQISLSAGFSSLESFILQAGVSVGNFRGLGQTVGAQVDYSRFSKSIEANFVDPYAFDRNISVSGSIFRRDLNSFNFLNNSRQTTFQQTTTGFRVQAGTPVTEYVSFLARYSLSLDNVDLDRATYFFNGSCDPLIAGRYLCDALGNRTSSIFGFSLIYDDRDNRLRPTRGQSLVLNQDIAGLGGSIAYIKTRLQGSKHIRLFGNFVLNAYAEGGYIYPLGSNGASAGGDRVRLVDRFFLGEPQLRGFDIRGVGPRVIRYTNVDLADNRAPVVNEDRRQTVDDALGGRAYYQGRLEMDLPLGSGARELGLRPSIFIDIGSVFDVRRPSLTTLASFRDTDGNFKTLCRNSTNGTTQFGTQATDPATMRPGGEFNQCPTGFGSIRPFDERFFGDSISPRVAIGFGVNWNSPFGPFRIDISHVLLKQAGDDTKRITFNVGTSFQ